MGSGSGRAGSTGCVHSGRRWHRRIPELVHDSRAAHAKPTGAHMTWKGRLVALAALVVLAEGCASLRTPTIAELRGHPARYDDRTVSINGVVTSSWGLPVLPFKFYQVDDGTGELTVLSQNRRLPSRGDHVRVKGRVDEVAVFGGQTLGLHLREQDLHVK